MFIGVPRLFQQPDQPAVTRALPDSSFGTLSKYSVRAQTQTAPPSGGAVQISRNERCYGAALATA
jgi:hypothetical protein